MNQDDNKKSTQVVDFTAKFKTQSELREYARAQFLTLLQANKRIEHLEQENRQLKSQLTIVEQDPKVEILPRSDEQSLCEIEIKRLRDKALDAPLSLEDTKRLDILVKNLYLAKGKPTFVPADAKKLKDIPEAELLDLANISDTKE